MQVVTFHHLDELFQIKLFYGLAVNWALELAGIYMIILGEVEENTAPDKR